MLGQECAVVSQLGEPSTLDLCDGGRQCHVAEFLMVAVGFAVGRAVDELGALAIRGEASHQAGYETLATIEGVLEGGTKKAKV